ncbi:MAG: hypothetical protein WBZ29_16005 [Methanocella sp.]
MSGYSMKKVRAWIAWILLGLTILYLLSGFGITYPGIVEPLTAGIMGKALAFRVHDLLWIPFIALLAVHVILNISRIARLKK